MSEITNQPLYLIKFDDTEVPDETMFGAEVANKRFEQLSGNWNAHLFVKVASNSRDDSCSGSNAKLTSDYDAVAAQRDEGLAREAGLREDLAIFMGAISALGEASKKLCFNARTVTDGPDQALMDACEAVEQTITLSGIARAMDYVEGLRNENAQLSEKYEAARDRTNSITLLQQRLAEAKRLLLDVRGQLCGPDQRAIDAFLASPGYADGEKAPAPSVNLPRRKVKTEYSTAQADAWNAALDAVQELNR